MGDITSEDDIGPGELLTNSQLCVVMWCGLVRCKVQKCMVCITWVCAVEIKTVGLSLLHILPLPQLLPALLRPLLLQVQERNHVLQEADRPGWAHNCKGGVT